MYLNLTYLENDNFYSPLVLQQTCLKQIYFSFSFFKKILQNIDLDYWINLCYQYKSKFSSVKLSNIGGYQSNSNLEIVPEFFGLVDILNYNIRTLTNSNNRITNLWLNISSYHHFNVIHNHDDKTHNYTSGVLYLKTPSNCGNIRVYNPLNLNDSIDIEVSEGTLILFPSYLSHSVDPNLNKEEDRISLAFNCEL